MWKPAAKIKYTADPGPWPSKEQASSSRLFSPIELGPIKLAQRTWVPAMVPWRATEEGAVTQDVLDWYGAMARGRPGGLVIEATGVRDVPSGPLLRIGHDRFIPGLRELASVVRRESAGETKLFIQLIDFLAIKRRPSRDNYFNRFLEISEAHRSHLGLSDDGAVRDWFLDADEEAIAEVLSERELEAYRMGYRERVTDMHLSHIAELPRALPGLFADAALRAKQAGIDGVELHYAHAYTMASFLSPKNTRPDGYGGARENRARLPLEVFAAVRDAVGSDYPVGCRFLAEECILGGGELDDACYFGAAFARAGMDFLSTSRGGKFDDAKQPPVGAAAYPYTGRSGYECMPAYLSDEQGPFGRNVEPTAAIRRAVRAAGFTTPVIVTGGIHGFEAAERLLQDGKADIVGAARQTLADPVWFRKVRLGRGAEVRICEYTNYCEGLDQKHKMVTCKLWDRVDLEDGSRRTPDGKRRTTAPRWAE